ncbi:MAG: hypothetical protein WCW30_00515 [Candidatus Gracilibacteria bacterium]
MAPKAPAPAPTQKNPEEKAQRLTTEAREWFRLSGICLSDRGNIPGLIQKLNPRKDEGSRLKNEAQKLINQLTEAITSLINQYGISPAYIRLITDLSNLLSDLNVILSLSDPTIQGVQEYCNWEQPCTWDLTLSNSPHVARLTAWKATIWNQQLNASSRAVIRTNPLLTMGVLGIDYRNQQQPTTPTWLAPELTESTLRETPREKRGLILRQIAHMMKDTPQRKQKWVAVSLPGENEKIPAPTLWGSPLFERKPDNQLLTKILINIRRQKEQGSSDNGPITSASLTLLTKPKK